MPRLTASRKPPYTLLPRAACSNDFAELPVAMPCPCVLQGGPSYTADTESMFIGNVACCEPGVSGVGWVWIDVGHLELNGYTDDAIGAEGEIVANRSAHHALAPVPPI